MGTAASSAAFTEVAVSFMYAAKSNLPPAGRALEEEGQGERRVSHVPLRKAGDRRRRAAQAPQAEPPTHTGSLCVLGGILSDHPAGRLCGACNAHSAVRCIAWEGHSWCVPVTSTPCVSVAPCACLFNPVCAPVVVSTASAVSTVELTATDCTTGNKCTVRGASGRALLWSASPGRRLGDVGSCCCAHE